MLRLPGFKIVIDAGQLRQRICAGAKLRNEVGRYLHPGVYIRNAKIPKIVDQKLVAC
jgi:hypothetical protein